jgi:hypothetical protein
MRINKSHCESIRFVLGILDKSIDISPDRKKTEQLRLHRKRIREVFVCALDSVVQERFNLDASLPDDSSVCKGVRSLS